MKIDSVTPFITDIDFIETGGEDWDEVPLSFFPYGNPWVIRKNDFFFALDYDFQTSYSSGKSTGVMTDKSDNSTGFDGWGTRIYYRKMLDTWGTTLNVLGMEDDLAEQLDIAWDNLNPIRTFLDKLALAVNVLSPNANLSETTINTWKANISTARSVINLSVAALSTVKNTLNSTKSGLEIAQLNYDQAQTGGRTEDVISAEAQLKQAEAGLQSAYANLEKTIIRAPISGTINTLNLEKGDFVSAFQPVVSLANNKSLEVIAYITEEDRTDITVGADTAIKVGDVYYDFGVVEGNGVNMTNVTVAMNEVISSGATDVPVTTPGLLFVEDEDKSDGTTKTAIHIVTTDAGTYSTVSSPVFSGTSGDEDFDTETF